MILYKIRQRKAPQVINTQNIRSEHELVKQHKQLSTFWFGHIYSSTLFDSSNKPNVKKLFITLLSAGFKK